MNETEHNESRPPSLRTWTESDGRLMLCGDIDLATASTLDRVLGEDSRKTLIVDLTAIGVLQSAGVAVLFEHARGRELTVLVRSGSAVAAVLAICGMGTCAQVQHIAGP